ncbi:MAG: bifunctional oligoribonuclease/PAP phosphatase NrnA [Planctomycetales bacterium]|nr:bifunctional oligoribonuclease/PAP phosphatase NrnA [Planctomycetales bacterium]
MKKSAAKLEQLKAVLQGHTTLLIVLQDNPDPDAIASAVALRKLANTLFNIQCSIAHGGRVGRGENRAMVKYLGLNLRPMDQVDTVQFERVALVDTQPGTGNNSLPPQVEPDIVIDHHRCRPQTRLCRFTDIRSRYGATATILTEYLRCAKIKPDIPLATALLYAIRSDTQDLGRDTTHADIAALTQLLPVANKRMLSQIQHGIVERDYFQMLGDALKNAQVYANAIVTSLGSIDNPDMIAETADLLLRDDLTDWVMVYGCVKDKMLISLRTDQEQLGADAVICRMVGRKGTGGGHPSYAGGQIPLNGLSGREIKKLEKKLISRFVRDVAGSSPKPEKLI